jgi:hypothetical protein
MKKIDGIDTEIRRLQYEKNALVKAEALKEKDYPSYVGKCNKYTTFEGYLHKDRVQVTVLHYLKVISVDVDNEEALVEEFAYTELPHAYFLYSFNRSVIRIEELTWTEWKLDPKAYERNKREFTENFYLKVKK